MAADSANTASNKKTRVFFIFFTFNSFLMGLSRDAILDPPATIERIAGGVGLYTIAHPGTGYGLAFVSLPLRGRSICI